MLAVSHGWLYVEVNYRTTGARSEIFTTAVKEKWILSSQITTGYKGAGGEAENSP